MRVPGRSDLFIARQPILDRELTLRAYELLFRPTARADAAGGHDLNHMASQVILGALSDIGLDDVVMEAGGLERRIRAFRLPEENPHREMRASLTVPLSETGDNPLWVSVVTEDGFQAWSSPVFVFH